MLPPNIKIEWDDNDWWTKELILAYAAGRDLEELKQAAALVGAKV